MATAEEIRASAQAALDAQNATLAEMGGQSAAQTVVQPFELEGKTYYHQIPGSRFHYMIAPSAVAELMFIGGKVTTSDPMAIAELDKVANKNGSGIYTDSDTAKRPTLDQLEAKSVLLREAAQSRDRMLAAGEKVT
jgi:hypothetical protein